MLTSLMRTNGWLPTVFEDFFNNDFMPRVNTTAPAVNVKHHYLRREFSYSNYEQNYTLPEDVDKEGIAAKVENGILTVTLPKVKKEEKKEAKAIEIS